MPYSTTKKITPQQECYSNSSINILLITVLIQTNYAAILINESNPNIYVSFAFKVLYPSFFHQIFILMLSAQCIAECRTILQLVKPSRSAMILHFFKGTIWFLHIFRHLIAYDTFCFWCWTNNVYLQCITKFWHCPFLKSIRICKPYALS